MKVIILQDDLYAYLQHVVRVHAKEGIEPEEGLSLFYLNEAVKGAQTVDDKQVAKVNTGEVAGVPVATLEVVEPPSDYVHDSHEPL